MTPDKALRQLGEQAKAIFEAGALGAETKYGEPEKGIPCGGLNGTSFSKVIGKLGAVVITALPESRWDESLQIMQDKAESLGLTTQRVKAVSGGTDVQFRGEAGTGGVELRPDGSLRLSAETECLPNPER